jgi:transcriptional regulator with XRE-family HTH domain
MASESERKFAEDVRSAMERKKITQVQLAAVTGIRQDHLSRLLKGERLWKPGHIERVCRALEIEPFRYLADEIMRCPVEGIITQVAFKHGPVVGTKKVPRTVSAKIPLVLDKAYCLEVEDDSLAPFINKGAILYINPKPDKFEDGDLVVYINHSGGGKIYLLADSTSESPKLRTLSKHYEDIILHPKHLKVLERVSMIYFP